MCISYKFLRLLQTENHNLPTASSFCASSIIGSQRVKYPIYRKVPKFSNARKLFCNLPKIQEKRPNLRVCCQKDANGIANNEDPDQTAPLGAV